MPCRTVAWNISLETTLSSAAVARGFASYLATLIGLSASSLRISVGPIQLDPAAALLVLLLTALLIKGTKESSLFNMVGAAMLLHCVLARCAVLCCAVLGWAGLLMSLSLGMLGAIMPRSWLRGV